jgi:dipeptidyl aminopeptidase/acylaminoacyl peptidase
MRIITVLLSVLLLCVVTGDVIAQTDPKAVYRMDMSANGTRFATSNAAGLTLYDAEFNPINFRAYTSLEDYLYINPYFSPDGTRILVRNEIWDSTTLETVTTLPLDKVIEPQWSADSQMILTWPRGAQIHSAQDGSLIRELMFEQRWGSDTTYFVRSVGDQITFTDATTGAEIANYVFPGQRVGWPLWTADGTRFAMFTFRMVEPGTPNSQPIDSGAQAILESLFIVDVPSGNRIHVEGLPAGIGYAAWSPDGQYLAGGSNAASLYVWDTTTGAVVESYALPSEKWLRMVRYSPTGGRLVVGMIDSSVTSSLVDTTLRPTSTFSQTQLGGAFQIFAPAASPEKLQAITKACGVQPSVQQSLTAQITTNKLQDFTAQVSALTDAQIPPGCKADLLAVAEALMAKGQ